MEHQDWKTYIHYCKLPTKKEPTTRQKVVKKQNNSEYSKIKKMDSMVDEGNLKHTKVSHNLRMEIQKKRSEKNLTQKQVAQILSIPESKIKEIESGKAIKEHQLINKINRFLKS